MTLEIEPEPVEIDKAPHRAIFADWLSSTNEITRAFLAAGQIPGLINIAGGLPDPATYPADEIATIAAEAIRAHPAETLGYGPIEGLPDLRLLIAQRYSTASMTLSKDNVLITTSGMQGLDLLGKVLLNKGDVIAGQFPTYLGALDAWRPRQPQFRNMDLASADCDPFAAMKGAKFAYTVPNFSNPTGRLVDVEMRETLLSAARITGAWLIEDDPYGTLNFDGPLPPSILEIAMQRGDTGPVVYMSTMSKLISPGLRVGWIIAAPEMIEALTLAKQGSDMCTSGITQRIACEVLKTGIIEARQPQIIAHYRNRRDAICAAMSEHLSDWFEWEVPAGGMFVWAKASNPRINTDRLFQIGLEEKVCVSPSSVFDAHGKECQSIRMNFTLNSEEKLTEAIKRLARAVKRLLNEDI
jgi:2-aminoadipate transaminase